jgi:spore maturation protein A
LGNEDGKMINYIWFGLFAIGIMVAMFTGEMKGVTEGIFGAASSAVELSLGLIGVMALWLGLMRIAEAAGAVNFISRRLHPVLRRLFPGIPPGHHALGSIVANLAANMLGLGNSATALGLKAMKDLQELNPEQDTATNDMCTFLAINTSSVTIIPATIIAIRASAGSSAPAEIIGTTLVATTASTVTAIVAVKMLEKLGRRKKGGKP